MAIQGDTTRVQHNAPIIVEQIQMSDGNNNHVVMMGQMQDGAFVAVKQADQEKVVYAGISKGAAVINRMIGADYSEMQELLTRAVNNRTRQRNFFRLQNSMLEGQITEEEFYKTDSEEKKVDNDKFLDYKLDLLEEVEDRKTYTVEFTLTKEEKDWVLDDLSNENISKIHGLYNE